MRAAIFYSENSKTLSYRDDWLDAFVDSDLDVDLYSNKKIKIINYYKILFKYDFIILLHSTNSNGIHLPRLIRLGLLRLRTSKMVLFIGNEYKLMPEKISFINQNRSEFVVSQLPIKAAQWLYKKTKSQVISLPHALNEKAFNANKHISTREVDIGARSYEYPWYLGDIDRSSILSFLGSSDFDSDLNIDISTNPQDRFNRKDWAGFLNNCKFTISSEAGSSYLERDDKTRKKVNQFVENNPEVSFNTVYDMFFLNYKGCAINGKCISSRHFDAIGTKTCQILLEGKYNDILEADKHYIELKKDLSNIKAVMEKIRNDKVRKDIVDSAYKHVIENHTYAHRIDFLLRKINK